MSVAALLLLAAVPVQAVPLGEDAAACVAGTVPAIQVSILGLKDRTGRLKLELYPANEGDFLKDDRDLVREGKVFRRVWAQTPAGGGSVQMCIRAPAPGRYALLLTHDRDNRNKFNFWRDGAGFPSNTKLGRSRPKLAQAVIAVGGGVTGTSIRVQYLRGLGGFSPIPN
ncbi:Uncharacterized conserved protein, DUF2141 family [Sphingomonas guangdongensis]|uniref:Uncharacterized conserved protein, DUF2141 family n=1 Tax=Sphingomonas guangdongensis TaxID=1141890 RepID=A0A285QCL6_9SPHN|nr:DUF2141 domain-containing protein [Sphingomonas guangdongensis]SOB79623.1 Uncharacterized conserved protein, DUF2141 family [Sphingomonas guangdongensis]